MEELKRGKRFKIIAAALGVLVIAVIAVVAVLANRTNNNENGKDSITDTENGIAVVEKEQDTRNSPVETTTQAQTEEQTTIQETTTQEQTTVEEQTSSVQVYNNGVFTFEDTGDTKYAYLTFDDGPSENTYCILDILNQYGVKGTFFTNYRDDQASVDRYKAIVDNGHAIGMHSSSHDYKNIYASLDNFAADTAKIHDRILQVTGVDTRLYRFPGGSSNTVSPVDMQVYVDYLTSIGYMYYDWNVSSGDASGKDVTAEQMIANISTQMEGYNRVMILMHDATVKTETVRALPGIIETLQSAGYQIVPITENTRPIQHVKAMYMQ